MEPFYPTKEDLHRDNIRKFIKLLNDQRLDRQQPHVLGKNYTL